MKQKQKAFTLVELVIVLAIIGILTAVILGSLSAAQQKAQDQRRQSDLKEIQIDLAQFYQYYGSYPTTTPLSTSNLANFVAGGATNLPTDPITHQSYYYAPTLTSGSAYTYCLGAKLSLAVPPDNVASCGNDGGLINYMQSVPQ